MEQDLNKDLIAQTLGFHGLPLIKTWNEEKGSNSLVRLGIQQNNIDTSVYHQRLKVLNFTDRTKRLRLHRFICAKTEALFTRFREDPSDRRIKKLIASGGDSIPPFEYYTSIDKDERLKRFFSGIKVGDIAYCTVTQLTKFGLLVKVLCTSGQSSRLVSDLNIKGIIAPQNLISALDNKNVTRQFIPNDHVCCEVLEITDHPQLNLGMRGVNERYDNGPQLGLISSQQLPQFYKVAVDSRNQNKTYNDLLSELDSFKNPAIVENLFIESGLRPQSHYSFMSSSKGKYPQDEYAKDLRQLQASKLAFRSVAEGIEHFKEGRHTEAFQCLNKALSIDPRNVEGLVARGALYANSGSFNKAIVDFEAALGLNGNHANAKKYLCETLLALGRNYEEDNKFEEARKAYIDCLKINPHHQEACASLEYLKTKLNAKKIVEPAELELPPLNIGSIPLLKDSKSSRDYLESSKPKDDSRKKAKKDKKRKGKKRHSSSSESSSDSSDSSDSSSESSDNSSSSTDSDSNSRKKKDKKRHEKSLSPLSRRMDLADSSYKFVNQSYDAPDDHEMKVRKFLEMGRDEDDYEERVRQLMAETSKYQKSKQAEEAKSAKKKKKSEKKLKKEKKKRKKEEKKKSKGNEIENLREALKMFENLPEFSKFQKIYNDKIKEEEMKQKQAEHDDGAPEKWKMKFAKDERQGDSKQRGSGKQQFGFNYESDEDEQARNFQAHPVQSTSAASTSGFYDKNKKRSPPPKPKLEIPPVALPIIPKGPVVLDKFGNFRLADPVAAAPPKPLEPTSSTRRSRSRSRRRDDSRSPRRRRSGSYRRRYSRSRSYSRSYSRSRSRSPRGRRVFRGRGGFNQRSRFSPKRMNQASRGRWGDNYRDTRDFRGGRVDRFNNNRDRLGNRGGGRPFGRFNRSFSRSPERSPIRHMSPDSRRDDDRRNKDGRWGEEDSIGKPDLDEMEEMLKKARKEKMDDMMERNKDLIAKKPW